MKGSISVGSMMFVGMAVLCFLGSWMLPLDVHKSESELKNLAPSQAYLSYPSDIEASNIKDIQSGISFSAALLQDHSLVVWGDVPFAGIAKEHIQRIAVGNHHMLVMEDTMHIYRLEGEKRKELPWDTSLTIKNLYAGNEMSACLYDNGVLTLWESVGTGMMIPDDLQGHIQDIAIGSYHIALLLDDGSIRIIGNQGSELAEIPQELQNEGAFLIDVAISNDAGIALDRDGNVYTWGNSSDAFRNLSNIKQIDASSHTLFALDETGYVYAQGSNAYKEMEFAQDDAFDAIYADTYQIYGIHEDKLQAWGHKGFLLGSDAMGRDILTRLLHGGRITMLIGLIVCVVEMVLGTLIGMLAGYFGGWVDHLCMRLCEVVASIPFLPLVITISAFMKDSFDENTRIIFIMVLLGVLSAPSLARMIRSIIMVEREKEYVTSAKVLGANTRWILRHELFPQILHVLLVNLTLSYADSMLIESSLSFLGFGVVPPTPTWGNMLDVAQSTYVLKNCWWQWVIPAICILLCVLSINLIGEGLRKRWNPQEDASCYLK